MDTDVLIQFAVRSSMSVQTHSPKWTPEEDAYLVANLGYLTDEQMGQALGRSAIGVHLRWDRDLGLPGPSKAPNVVTAQGAAEMLGIDSHKIAHWVDVGMISGRLMAGERKIRLIDRQVFRRWVLNPMNWVWFDPKKVRDPELKRMLKKRAALWGDEWWSTRQVADYHGVDPKDVERYVRHGQLHSFRLPFSLGGRDHNRKWSNHFILKSEAVRVVFYNRGKGNAPKPSQFTPAADRWLLKARDELHMTFVHIGRTMKIGAEKCNKKTGTATSNPTIAYRYKYLKSQQAAKNTRRRAK